jgi:hypothetical protein
MLTASLLAAALALFWAVPGFASIVFHCQIDGQAHDSCCCVSDDSPPPAPGATVAPAGCCDVQITSAPTPSPKAQAEQQVSISVLVSVASYVAVSPPAPSYASAAVDSAPAIRPPLILTKHSRLI